ncbi:MAG: HU family DNA-binding protein [Rubellimicrobium sp.]|nr:HU family DNA-binding protein [Rubellimicrobium sp.]
MTDTDDELPPSITMRAPMKKAAFLDLVAADAGLDAARVAPVADATLAAIAQVLESGQALAIPPLGRLKIIKEKSGRAGHQLLLRLTVDRGTAGED